MGVLPFHYQGSTSISKCEPGVRLIFSDINVAPSAAPPHAQHAALASIFDALLHETNGPWVLVAWTASPTQVSDLHEALVKALGRDRAPIAAIGLEKTGFANAQGEFDIAAIAAAVRQKVEADPVVAAVMDLEARAAEAAHDVMRSLLALAAPDDAPTIADLLKALSLAADDSSPPSAEKVFQTIGPAVQDRMIRRGVTASEKALWDAAFAKSASAQLTQPQRAELNTMLHLDPAAAPGERGAISVIAPGELASLKRAIRIDPASLVFEHYLSLEKALKSRRAAVRAANVAAGMPNAAIPDAGALELEIRSQLKWCLIEAAAACDAANAKRGIRRALLAIVVPVSLGPQTLAGDHGWLSPVLDLDSASVTVALTSRVVISPLPKSLASIKPIARLRDPLLDGILQHVAGSHSRLGWIYF